MLDYIQMKKRLDKAVVVCKAILNNGVGGNVDEELSMYTM